MTKCSVLGGEFALFMQGGLAFITCSVLVWKKYMEHGDRSWFDFGLDSSKQIAGAGWIHVANMLCAILFAEELVGVDGCTWYAANIIIDTTLGVGVEWALLQGVQWALRSFNLTKAKEILETGSYWRVEAGQRKFLFANYACRLALWLAIVTLMKVSMVALMQVFPFVVYGINLFVDCFGQEPRIKLFVVMICIPMAMNTFQFVITDNFIKKKPQAADPCLLAGVEGASSSAEGENDPDHEQVVWSSRCPGWRSKEKGDSPQTEYTKYNDSPAYKGS